MTTMTEKEAKKGEGTTIELRALDPDLPMLAARAAMQLDLAIGAARQGKAVGKLKTDAINQLSTMVTNATSAMSGTGTLRALMDPLTANIVSRAYADASNNPPKSRQDLEVAVTKLSKLFELSQVFGNGPRAKENGPDPLESLQLLRDFCVKLSEYAASKRQLAYGERPVPVYWRLS